MINEMNNPNYSYNTKNLKHNFQVEQNTLPNNNYNFQPNFTENSNQGFSIRGNQVNSNTYNQGQINSITNNNNPNFYNNANEYTYPNTNNLNNNQQLGGGFKNSNQNIPLNINMNTNLNHYNHQQENKSQNSENNRNDYSHFDIHESFEEENEDVPECPETKYGNGLNLEDYFNYQMQKLNINSQNNVYQQNHNYGKHMNKNYNNYNQNHFQNQCQTQNKYSNYNQISNSYFPNKNDSDNSNNNYNFTSNSNSNLLDGKTNSPPTDAKIYFNQNYNYFLNNNNYIFPQNMQENMIQNQRNLQNLKMNSNFNTNNNNLQSQYYNYLAGGLEDTNNELSTQYSSSKFDSNVYNHPQNFSNYDDYSTKPSSFSYFNNNNQLNNQIQQIEKNKFNTGYFGVNNMNSSNMEMNNYSNPSYWSSDDFNGYSDCFSQSNNFLNNFSLQDSLISKVNTENVNNYLLNYMVPMKLKMSVARYFIIKSIDEDNIIKSIKSSIWSSTQKGNTKLNKIYKEVQGKFPIYLFFSVNASGKFLGVARMTSDVDSNKNKTDWSTTDKWKGFFHLHWLIIKDLPNKYLKSLNNSLNEGKCVVSSRDTQEVEKRIGEQIMQIFINFSHENSIVENSELFPLTFFKNSNFIPNYYKQGLNSNNNINSNSENKIHVNNNEFNSNNINPLIENSTTKSENKEKILIIQNSDSNSNQLKNTGSLKNKDTPNFLFKQISNTNEESESENENEEKRENAPPFEFYSSKPMVKGRFAMKRDEVKKKIDLKNIKEEEIKIFDDEKEEKEEKEKNKAVGKEGKSNYKTILVNEKLISQKEIKNQVKK